MMTFGRLDREVMAGPVTLTYWWGEVGELWVELRALNLPGIREEWSDVACLGVLALIALGLPLGWVPVLPGFGLYAARKFERRLETWKRIFAHHGVPFDRGYLIGGGNFAKLAKVRLALGAAGVWGKDVDETWLRAEGICTQ